MTKPNRKPTKEQIIELAEKEGYEKLGYKVRKEFRISYKNAKQLIADYEIPLPPLESKEIKKPLEEGIKGNGGNSSDENKKEKDEELYEIVKESFQEHESEDVIPYKVTEMSPISNVFAEEMQDEMLTPMQSILLNAQLLVNRVKNDSVALSIIKTLIKQGEL